MNDKRTMMAPPGTSRWYDGEPKLPLAKIFRPGEAHTALWLIRVVVSNPTVEINAQ